MLLLLAEGDKKLFQNSLDAMQEAGVAFEFLFAGALGKKFPALAIPDTAQGLVGLYDATSDWIHIYDRTSLPGFFVEKRPASLAWNPLISVSAKNKFLTYTEANAPEFVYGLDLRERRRRGKAIKAPRN